MRATCKGKQEQTRKTVRETKAGAQNGARASEKESGHANRCENEQKQIRARKMMQEPTKTDMGTQNGAKNGENRC